MSFLVSSSITIVLVIASALTLNLPWTRVVFFAVAICMMSASLSGLAVGLGALFPDFKEDNPSKIVSSFGGTLCLVISFIYNTTIVILLAVPDIMRVTKRHLPFPDWLTPAIAVLVSAAMILIPMKLALQRVKNLEM